MLSKNLYNKLVKLRRYLNTPVVLLFKLVLIGRVDNTIFINEQWCILNKNIV